MEPPLAPSPLSPPAPSPANPPPVGPASAEAPPGTPRLGLATRAAYGVGQVAEGAKNTAFDLFLFFYYNQVLGLSGTLSGAAMLIALAVDAATDPLVGSLSDSLRSRWGRRHPFLYASALPLGCSFALLFRPPEGLGQLGLFGWLTLFAVATRVSMTLYFVPHLALGAELSSDYRERTTIVAWRTFFGVGGAAALSVAGLGWWFRSTPAFPIGQLDAAAYPSFGATFAVVMALAIWLCAAGTHHRIPHLAQPVAAAPFGLRRLLGEMGGALANPSFRALFVGLVVFFVMRGVQTALGLHMGTYFWRITTEEILQLTIATIVGFLAGLPFWSWASQRLDKRPSFLIGVAGFSAFVLVPPVLEIVGWYPARASAAYLGGLVAASGLAGFFGAAGLVTAGSMMADVADEYELTSGRRQEGVLFGAQSLAAKSASGIGHQIAGVGLDLIGFPSQPGTVAAVGAPQVLGLGLLAGPGVGVLALVAIAVLARYRIDRRRHAEIALALAARRRARAAGGADPGAERGRPGPEVGASIDAGPVR